VKKSLRVPVAALMVVTLVSSALTSVASGAISGPANPRWCVSVPSPPVGRIGGLLVPRVMGAPTSTSCSTASRNVVGRQPPYNPFVNTGTLSPFGSTPVVMGESQPVTVTPIFWAPTNYGFDPSYRALVTQFINDLAVDSGTTSFVSVLTQYGSTSSSNFQGRIAAGPALTVTDPYPATGGCTPDTGSIYADTSAMSACVTDSQIQGELSTVLSANHLVNDVNHIYLVYLPKGVEVCTNLSGANAANGGQCNVYYPINSSSPTSGFCGYHSAVTSSGSAPGIYATLPYPVVDGFRGDTCSSDGAYVSQNVSLGNQSPNANIDADTEISVLSHELSEAITDPEVGDSTYGGWVDASQYEIGDKCAYNFGDTLAFGGTSGAFYNQTINGHHYFIQGEFSNSNFTAFTTSYSCALTSQQSILFDPTLGSGAMAPVSGAVGTRVTLPLSSLNYPGHYLSSWNTDPNGVGTAYADGATLTLTAPMTLYAQWSLGTKSTVFFDANGGVGAMAPVTHGTATALPAATVTRAGYSFAGWNTSPTGTGTSYADGAVYPFTASATLYAQWTSLTPLAPTKVTVTYAVNTATISWTAVAAPAGTSILGYRLFAGYTPTSTSVVLAGNPSLMGSTSFHATHLRNGQRYYFSVVAVGSAGTSTPSAPAYALMNEGRTRTTFSVSKKTVAFAKQNSVLFTFHVVSLNSEDPPTGVVHIIQPVSATKYRLFCVTPVPANGVVKCHLPGHSLTRGVHRLTEEFAGSIYSFGSGGQVFTITVTK